MGKRALFAHRRELAAVSRGPTYLTEGRNTRRPYVSCPSPDRKPRCLGMARRPPEPSRADAGIADPCAAEAHRSAKTAFSLVGGRESQVLP